MMMEMEMLNLKKAFDDGQYDLCSEQLNLLSSAGDDDVDERKLSLNKCLVSFAKSGWKNPDSYVAAISRTTPDPNSKPEDDRFRLYNLGVVSFHCGQYKQALNLVENVLRLPNDTETSYGSECANLIRSAHLLRIEICLLLYQPQKALGYLEELKSCPYYDTTAIDLVNHIRMAEARTYLLLKRFRSFRYHNKSLSEKEQWPPALCRAQFEHLSGNPRHALTLLLAATDTYPDHWQLKNHSECKQLVLNNAFGCIYAASLNKPHLSMVYFQNALVCLTNKHEIPRSLFGCPPTWRYGLMYNIALSLLHANEPYAAFDCFLSVLQVFHDNPRLWLRLAECCVMAHKTTNRSSFELEERIKEMIKQVIGVGLHRKVILRTSFGVSETSHDHQTGGSGAIPVVSLEFASLCLRNALALLPIISESDLMTAAETNRPSELAENNGDLGENRLPVFKAMPGPPMSVSEVHRVRCSILCDLAYVCLCLNDIQMAHEHANRLIKHKFLSPAHNLMARLYMAEASILMDRPSEAIHLLDPESVNSLVIPELWLNNDTWSVSHNWYPNSISNAKAILIYNLAVIHAIKGNFSRASDLIKQINTSSEMTPSIENLMLGLYLQLQLGNSEFAKAFIHRNLMGHTRP